MIQDKLFTIQQRLKAPKDQTNDFGNYKYRSAEAILEQVKPILNEIGCTLTISDEVAYIGDRYYIKATAKLMDGDESITTVAYAREAEAKKGMDESQVTGATSSYARKYALNGLFCIDDTKDTDSNEFTEKRINAEMDEPATQEEKKVLEDLCAEYGLSVKDTIKKVGWKSGTKLTKGQYAKALELIKEVTNG